MHYLLHIFFGQRHPSSDLNRKKNVFLNEQFHQFLNNKHHFNHFFTIIGDQATVCYRIRHMNECHSAGNVLTLAAMHKAGTTQNQWAVKMLMLMMLMIHNREMRTHLL